MEGTYNMSYDVEEPNPPKERVYTVEYDPQHKCKTSATDTSTADFETALEKTGYGKFNYLILLLAIPATCASNFDTATLSFALPTATCELKLTSYDRGLLNGTIYVGMISSAFLWGYLSDTYGRKKLLTIGFLLDSICCIAVSLSQSFWNILILKYLSGFIICGPHSIFMTYLSEVFSRQHRDRVILSTGIFTSVGGILQPLAAWAIIPHTIHWTFFNGAILINSWRVFMMIFALPSLVAGIFSIFTVESPKFLYAEGRKEEALQILRRIYSVNSGLPPEAYPVKEFKDGGTISNEKNNDMKNVLKNKIWKQITGLFRKPHICKALLMFTVQTGGLLCFNTIRLWLPQMFFYIDEAQKTGEILTTCEMLDRNYTQQTTDCENFKVDDSVYIHLVYVLALTAFFFIVSSFVVKYTGKKALLMISYFIGALATSFIPWVKDTHAIILAAIFVAILNTSAIGVLGCVVSLFPTNLRTMAVSLTMMFGRIGVFLASATFPFVLNYNCWLTFVILGWICFICGVLMAFIPSAKNNNVETDKGSGTDKGVEIDKGYPT